MDVGLKPPDSTVFSSFKSLFQSLFWWMLVLNTLCAFGFAKVHIVSILVLVDVGLKLDYADFDIPYDVEFQSLFWWMLVLNHFQRRLL